MTGFGVRPGTAFDPAESRLLPKGALCITPKGIGTIHSVHAGPEYFVKVDGLLHRFKESEITEAERSCPVVKMADWKRRSLRAVPA